jgi:hypothetical protein
MCEDDSLDCRITHIRLIKLLVVEDARQDPAGDRESGGVNATGAMQRHS